MRMCGYMMTSRLKNATEITKKIRNGHSFFTISLVSLIAMITSRDVGFSLSVFFFYFRMYIIFLLYIIS
jgi:hypothetical protein